MKKNYVDFLKEDVKWLFDDIVTNIDDEFLFQLEGSLNSLKELAKEDMDTFNKVIDTFIATVETKMDNADICPCCGKEMEFTSSKSNIGWVNGRAYLESTDHHYTCPACGHTEIKD